MSYKEKIIIKPPKVFNKKILIYQLDCSTRVSRFFISKTLVLEYPVDIDTLDTSIQIIPALASIINVAWILGADVYVDTIDKNYRESLDYIQSVMKDWYPDFPFSTKIFGASKINSFPNNNFALLYSAGLDSTTSYITHMKKNLILISISGNSESIDSQFKDKKLITPLSNEQNKILIVKTNIEKVIDVNLIYEYFGLNWWMNLSHGLVLSGHCAPLTVINHVGILYLASSFTRDFNYPWGSHPLIDNNICWANTNVVHDGFDATRQEKIMHILKTYGEKFGHFPKLKVCSKYQISESNCQRCEKCSRTIIGLLAAGVDPNKCGFKINPQTLNYIKDSLERGKFFNRHGLIERPVKLINRLYPIFEWEDIQHAISSDFIDDVYLSKDFFKWFKNFDIKHRANKITLKNMPSLLLYSFFDIFAPLSIFLPKSIQNKLRWSFNFFFSNRRSQ